MSEPDYVAEFRRRHGEDTSRLSIERSILHDWRREFSIGGAPTGCSWAEHFCCYVKELIPKQDINPFFKRMAEGVEETFWIQEKKIINFIGSQNSGKTDFFAVLTVALVSIDPQYSKGYVAAPFLQVAESTVWARIESKFDQMKERNPEYWKGARKVGERFIFYYHPEAGKIELITANDVGKLQGVKSRDVRRGFTVVIADEISKFQNKSLLGILDNIASQDNLLCMTGCNFRDTEGLDGDICRPEGREYEELDPDVDFEWNSAYKSRTYRFDGHKSPNIVAGKVLYHYLLKEKRRAEMEEIHGLDGPKYWEQIRSFPSGQYADYYITTRDKIRAGGGYDDFTYEMGEETKVAGLDPGFGGDPCVFCVAGFVPAQVMDSEGKLVDVTIMKPLDYFQTIKLRKGMTADREFLERFNAIKHKNCTVYMVEGQTVDMDTQIAVATGELLEKYGVPRSHMAYDGSMRSGIVATLQGVLGPECIPLNFGDQATQRDTALPDQLDEKGNVQRYKTARELYTNFISEMYFAFADLVNTGQLREAHKMPAAVAQFCKRKWENKGDRKKIEDKEKYKEMNDGRSPNDADAWACCLEAARRRGFNVARNKQIKQSTKGGAMEMLQEVQDVASRFKKKSAKRLKR